MQATFLTSALMEVKWSASRPGSTLPPVPIGQEAGWAPQLARAMRLEEKSSASTIMFLLWTPCAPSGCGDMVISLLSNEHLRTGYHQCTKQNVSVLRCNPFLNAAFVYSDSSRFNNCVPDNIVIHVVVPW
jgi:hypothetical protein